MAEEPLKELRKNQKYENNMSFWVLCHLSHPSNLRFPSNRGITLSSQADTFPQNPQFFPWFSVFQWSTGNSAVDRRIPILHISNRKSESPALGDRSMFQCPFAMWLRRRWLNSSAML